MVWNAQGDAGDGADEQDQGGLMHALGGAGRHGGGPGVAVIEDGLETVEQIFGEGLPGAIDSERLAVTGHQHFEVGAVILGELEELSHHLAVGLALHFVEIQPHEDRHEFGGGIELRRQNVHRLARLERPVGGLDLVRQDRGVGERAGCLAGRRRAVEPLLQGGDTGGEQRGLGVGAFARELELAVQGAGILDQPHPLGLLALEQARRVGEIGQLGETGHQRGGDGQLFFDAGERSLGLHDVLFALGRAVAVGKEGDALGLLHEGGGGHAFLHILMGEPVGLAGGLDDFSQRQPADEDAERGHGGESEGEFTREGRSAPRAVAGRKFPGSWAGHVPRFDAGRNELKRDLAGFVAAR